MFSHLLLVVWLSTTFGSALKHIVTVGANGLTFTPANTEAAIGDTVEFDYYPANHSVTQSSFKLPCTPLSNGFDSGFVPSTVGASMIPSYTLTITSTAPIWFYCAQGPHCTRGMVGAINAPASGNTIAAFIALSKTSTKANAVIVDSPSGVGATQAGSISSVTVPDPTSRSSSTVVAASPASGTTSLLLLRRERRR